MKKFEMIIKKALVSEGVMNADWRFKVNPIITKENFNFCEMEVSVYEPRCKKPCTVWSIPYDMTRDILHFCDAILIYNKYN